MKKTLSIVLSIYLLIVTALIAVSLRMDHGKLVYALDDPYIHMTMAKNFVTHGSWATNNMEFTSASSSPLWVLILSGAYLIFGVNTAAPFVLNILFQLLAITFACLILVKYEVSKFHVPILLVFVFVTPLLAILYTAMEHSAQVLFTLIFVYLGTKLIADNSGKFDGWKYLAVVTPVLTALRYEGVFLTGVVCVLLLVRKKYSSASIIFVLSLLPVVIYGLISVSYGWYFFPNTLLLKSIPLGYSAGEILKFCYKAFKNLTEPHIFLILILSLLLYVLNLRKIKDPWNEKLVFLMIAGLTAIVNMIMIEFHKNGWFYRYDAYLIAMGMLAITVNAYGFIPEIRAFFRERIGSFVKFAVILLAVIVISPFALRALSVFEVPFATKNIYDQHYQMAKFVKNYVADINIAANDIGMVDFYSSTGVLDLYGLASMEVANEKLHKTYNTQSINSLVKKHSVKLAIVYENGYAMYGGLPPDWVKIGEWTMNDFNFVCGYETVTFFSVNTEDTAVLREKLIQYSLQLPKSVTYKIF